MGIFSKEKPASVEEKEHYEPEKKGTEGKGEGIDLIAESSLPEKCATNSLEVPTYVGLSGTKLITAITTVATIGFFLFGYDQVSRACSNILSWRRSLIGCFLITGSYGWNYYWSSE